MRLLWTGLSLIHGLVWILWLQEVKGEVPAPENVTLRCGDQRPVLSWDYSPEQPTDFTVRLSGSGTSSSVQTADHELDLSGFVWKSPDQMFNFHVVSVRAEQGLNRSEPSRGLTFSYNRYKTAEFSCFLKFPSEVSLSREGAEATLSFENPLYFYEELRSIRASAEFDLTVVMENSQQDLLCGSKRVCKFSLNLPEDSELCLNLSGVISRGAEQILVQTVGSVCSAAPAPPTEVMLAIVVFVVFFAVISVVTLGLCLTRAWVFPKIISPKSLAPNPPSLRPSSAAQTETVYSLIQITGTRPRTIQDPLSLSPDPLSPSPDPDSPSPAEDRLLIPPPDPCEDQDESASSTKTETLSLHSESDSEPEESNYERRNQVLEMDLSGDLVTGYTG